MVIWNLIQIDSWLKNLSEILMRFNSWLHYTLDSVLGMIFLGFGSIHFRRNCYFQNNYHWTWLGVSFFGLSTDVSFREIGSNHFMTKAVSLRVESIPFITKAAFKELTQINSRLKRISTYWFWWTHDSNSFPGNWLRINSWLKWIPRYWFNLIHDSS